MDGDKRFAGLIATDPKFRRIPKRERKIMIDKRFESMFNDEKFKMKHTVDKRGRPIAHSSKEDLKRYYHLESEPSDEDDENLDEKKIDNELEDVGRFVRRPSSDSDDDDETSTNSNLNEMHKSDKQISKRIRSKLKDLKVDYARGEAALISSDSSSSDDDNDSIVSETEDEGINHNWGELDADAERTDAITSRLALCNMDWDRIRAVDLMVLFNSFLPVGGGVDNARILAIHIYPSEYGLQRMKEEEMNGPIELVGDKLNRAIEGDGEEASNDAGREATKSNSFHDAVEEEEEEGAQFQMEKLRKYQLNRLKYYYAVIECDCEETANRIYTECDGMEYESTATRIDLRFVPDEMSFADQQAKETCDKMPDINKYKPRYFTTTALQQAKVALTWDETDPERVALTTQLNKGKMEAVSDADLKDYLALSSTDDEDENGEADVNDDKEEDDVESEKETSIDKYKALLLEIESNETKRKERDVELEITWGINLKTRTDQLAQEKLAASANKTPFQQYLDKAKAKRKGKRLAKKQGEKDDSDDVPSDIDMNDPYFAEEFENDDFKNSKTKKKINNNKSKEATDEEKRKQAELELLLSSNGDEDVGAKKHFNLKKLQKVEKSKRKRKFTSDDDEDAFDVNVDDDRFSALFTSHHYNIDPTDSHFKRTKGMEKLIEAKIKRRLERDGDEHEEMMNPRKENDKKSAELSVLVKSVKRKANAAFGSNRK